MANGLSADRLLRQLDLIDQLNAELVPFRILTGIEVDILEDGALDQRGDLLARLDVVSPAGQPVHPDALRAVPGVCQAPEDDSCAIGRSR